MMQSIVSLIHEVINHATAGVCLSRVDSGLGHLARNKCTYLHSYAVLTSCLIFFFVGGRGGGGDGAEGLC